MQTEGNSSRAEVARKYHRLGVEALEAQRYEDAVQALRRAVELDPSLGDVWNDLGVVMEALGNPREAVQCYRRALSVQPAQADARSNLGLLMLQLNLAGILQRQAFRSSVVY
ncbi:MAG: tetratricopeptide repeat protein [Acidobacteria bacterium]|nr:tetratricopeptide repeat protein [Acidobacteriota bacterium]